MPKVLKIGDTSGSIRSASIVQVTSKFLNVIVQLGITMVLARLLTPSEYGVVAVLQVLSSLFGLLADSGISIAIARDQSLTRTDYERLFFFGLLMGVGLGLAFFVFSIGIAWFYGDDIYVSLGAVMSLAVFFNSLNMVPNGILLKERKFKVIAVRLVVCTVVVGAIVIALAYVGFGCFAIALNSVLTALFVLTWNIASSRLRMSFGDVRKVFAKVCDTFVYNLSNNVVGWLANNADTLLVGKMFGAETLGYYNKAYTLYAYPLNILTAPIVATLIPFLAELQNDAEKIRKCFLRVFHKISFLSALCVAGMNVCAPELILVMFGANWAEAIPLLAILAFAVYSRGVNGAFAALLNAVGRADLLMKSTATNAVVTLAMILLGGFQGSAQSLASCVAIAYNIEMILPIIFCSGCLEIKSLYFFKHFLPDLFAAIGTCALAYFVPWCIDNVVLSLAVKGLFVLTVMCAIKLALSRLVLHERIGIRDII